MAPKQTATLKNFLKISLEIKHSLENSFSKEMQARGNKDHHYIAVKVTIGGSGA